MKNTKLPLYETLSMIIGEVITSAVICGVFLILKKFELAVLSGVILGSAVTVANFLFLMIFTNRAIDKAIAERGDGELSDDEVDEFTAKHKANVEAAVKIFLEMGLPAVNGASNE